MGYPGKNRKSYETPRHPWQAARFVEEVELIKRYGLRNKRELWKAHSKLEKYREIARKLLAESAKGKLSGHIEVDAGNVLNRLKRFGILKSDANLDDILSLDVSNFLERRLQTQVHKQGLANTMKQSRQFIVHGHISVRGRKVTIPSYMVPVDEALLLDYYGGSPLTGANHPSRPLQIASSTIGKAVVVPDTVRTGMNIPKTETKVKMVG